MIHDGCPAGSKSYIWVHLTGALGQEPVIVVYEYQKTRHSDHPKEYYNSASERALRNFTIGRKNWMTINTIRGAEASAVIYSITETARANKLNVLSFSEVLSTK